MRIQILILGFKGLIGKAKIQNANVWKNKNTEFKCLKKKTSRIPSSDKY